MNSEQFNNRNVSDDYFLINIEDYPTDSWSRVKRVVKRTFRGELFVGLWVVMREMIRFDIHTIKYPEEMNSLMLWRPLTNCWMMVLR